MLTYLKNYSNMSFNLYPLNYVDKLILAQLSYCNFAAADDFEGESLSDAARQALENVNYDFATDQRFNFQIKDNEGLLECIAASERYGAIGFLDFTQKYDPDEYLQFTAMTLMMPDGDIYVVYRGTDNTLAGWKENCDMSFDMPIPSQREARKYLENVAWEYNGDIYVMGHSKGGNLAVFAAAFAAEDVQERIKQIISFDGPGMPAQVRKLANYQAVSDRIEVFMPKGSVVGLFFEQPDNVSYVESSANGIMQHYPFYWKTHRTDFIRVNELSAASKLLGETIHSFLEKLSIEQREQFVESVYSIITSTDAETLLDLVQGRAKSAIPAARAVLRNQPQTARMFAQVWGAFTKAVFESITDKD